MKEIIPIFFAVDNNYVPFLAVALTSIINNASTFYNYKIHIIQEGITEENMLQLKSLENDNFKIKFYSDELIACEPMLRVLETPGLSFNINIVKRNLSLTIGPFETKDYI